MADGRGSTTSTTSSVSLLSTRVGILAGERGKDISPADWNLHLRVHVREGYKLAIMKSLLWISIAAVFVGPSSSFSPLSHTSTSMRTGSIVRARRSASPRKLITLARASSVLRVSAVAVGSTDRPSLVNSDMKFGDNSTRRNFLRSTSFSAAVFGLVFETSMNVTPASAVEDNIAKANSSSNTKEDDPLASFGVSLSGMNNPTGGVSGGSSTNGNYDPYVALPMNTAGQTTSLPASQAPSLDDALKQSAKKRNIEPRTHG